MKRLFVLSVGLLFAALSAGCCCWPCCGSPCGGGYGGYGGCGPGGCPSPVGVPAGAYYAPGCNGACAY